MYGLYFVVGIHTTRFSNVPILTFAMSIVVLIVRDADLFLPTKRTFDLTDALKIIHSVINLLKSREFTYCLLVS